MSAAEAELFGINSNYLANSSNAISKEEAFLQAALDSESADAVLGDLAELYERDRSHLPEKAAKRLRRSRARSVEQNHPLWRWRYFVRALAHSLEMNLYWVIVILLTLLAWYAPVTYVSSWMNDGDSPKDVCSALSQALVASGYQGPLGITSMQQEEKWAAVGQHQRRYVCQLRRY